MNATYAASARCLRHMAQKPILAMSKMVALSTIFAWSTQQPLQAQPVQTQPSAQTKKKPPATSPELWPSAPTSEAKLLKSVRTDYYVPFLQIESPKAEPPLDDPLKYLAPQSADFRGVLLYAPFRPYVPGDDAETMKHNYHEFTMRGAGVIGQIEGEETSLAVYRTEAHNLIFDPLFSEDGKRILFKIGWPFESTGTYHLYLWNTTANTVRRLTKEGEDIKYNDVFWSPDGNLIAYVSGGDMSGKVWGKLWKQGLRILDVNNGKVRHVARNPGVIDVAWTHQGSLLFTMYPQDRKNDTAEDQTKDQAEAAKSKAKADEIDEEPALPERVSIYEASLKGRKAELLIENGYRPMPSPDGRWIAFFGLPPAAANQRVDAVLYLYDRQKQQRIATKLGEVTAMRWAPDSRSLVIMQTDYESVFKGPGTGTAAFRLLSVPSLAVRDLVALQAQDFEPKGGRNITSPMFRFVRFSRDSRFLFVGVNEFTGRGNGILAIRDTLRAIDLNDGSDTLIARIEDDKARVLSWDWHDESNPATPSLTLRAKKR